MVLIPPVSARGGTVRATVCLSSWYSLSPLYRAIQPDNASYYKINVCVSLLVQVLQSLTWDI